MDPFIISTIRFVMARPRPVLPYLFVRPLSSCEKASKILGMYSGSMPMPVSRTLKRSVD